MSDGRPKDNKVKTAIKNLFKSPDKNTTAKGSTAANKTGVVGGSSRSAAGSTSRSRNAVAPTKPEMKSTKSEPNKAYLSMMTHPTSINTSIRSRRLLKEYKEVQKIQSSRPDPCFSVDLVNDSLYEWKVRLHRVDPDSPLARDMAELKCDIVIRLEFPENFPFAPPFMHVVEPRIKDGYVMSDGAICMELLTPAGWASAYTVEALIMQFCASIVKGNGRINRTAKDHNSKELSRESATNTFKHIVRQHEKYGWRTPKLSEG